MFVWLLCIPAHAETAVATFYHDEQFSGTSASFAEGSYTLSDMRAAGLSNDAVSSIKVLPGYAAVLFYDNDFDSDSLVITSDCPSLAGVSSSYHDDWDNQVSSIRIRASGRSGLSKTFRFRNKDNGLYMDIEGNQKVSGAYVVQYENEGMENWQRFTLVETEEGNGVYYFKSIGADMRIGVESNANGTFSAGNFIYTMENAGDDASQFILVEKGNGYYGIVHRASGLAVNYSAGSAEERLMLSDNDGSDRMRWKLVPDGWNVAEIFKDKDFSDNSLPLPENGYNTEWLDIYGFEDNDLTSLKLLPGYVATLYDNDEFSGDSITFESATANVGTSWNDRMSSVRIRASGVSGMSGEYKLLNRNSGKYMDINNNSTSDYANVVQYNDEGNEKFQRFRLEEIDSSGVYYIYNVGAERYLQINDFRELNGQMVETFQYTGYANQQFILVNAGDGYYYLVARFCGKPVETPDNSTDPGEWLKIYDNIGTYTQQWQLVTLKPTGIPVCTVYNNINHDTEADMLALPEGEYELNDLQAYGFDGDILSSLEILPGYKITLYDEDGLTGNSVSYDADVSRIGEEWNDRAVSIKVEAWGVQGFDGDYKLQNRNSGLYMDVDRNSKENKAALIQYRNEYLNATQLFGFEELQGEHGVYRITNTNSGKSLDITDNSIDNGAVVQQYEYLGYAHQQFIVIETEDGYFQLIARHSGDVVEVPASSTVAGEWLRTYDNNGTYTQQWKIQRECEHVVSYELSGGGKICDNGGYAEITSNTQKGMNYCLLKDGNAYGDIVAGTGERQAWRVSKAGTYTVKAYDASYEECKSVATTMKGDIVIKTTSQPQLTVSPSAEVHLTVLQSRSFTSDVPVEWSINSQGSGPYCEGSGYMVASETETRLDAKFTCIGSATITATMKAPNQNCQTSVTVYQNGPVNEICAEVPNETNNQIP